MGVIISKEVSVLHVPDIGWTRGSWNGKRDQFDLLGRMIGLQRRPSSEQLQVALKHTASAKVFAESVEAFVAKAKAERGQNYDVANELEHLNKKLGTMELVPFRSMLKGLCDPSEFEGSAIWPAGTVGWTRMRWDEIRKAEDAGAKFSRIIVLGSSRQCGSPADRRHPYIRDAYSEGDEPTEIELMWNWVQELDEHEQAKYVFPELPEFDENDRPLSLEKMLRHLIEAHYFDKYLHPDGKPLYVPTNPNALYVPMHVRRVLGRSDIWFSQPAGTTRKSSMDWWWPGVQDLMTTPSGILRLWIELQHASCITN